MHRSSTARGNADTAPRGADESLGGLPAAQGASSAPLAGMPGTAPVERLLGRTGHRVLPVSLGGEGVLRTTGKMRQAVPVILEALRLGVRYCDTAPAYQQSQDYYGSAFREAGPDSRRSIFLASKTHQRSRDGSLRLLDDSLRRLGTDHLDLWQLHDLRQTDELDEIFGRGGAIEAIEQARADGRVRFAGITGHHDPAVLVEAIQRYPFDSVLCAINPADRVPLSFLDQVVPWPEGADGGGRNEGPGSRSHRRRWRRPSARAHPLCREPSRHGDHRLLGSGGGARQPRDRAEVHPDDAAGIDRS